MPKQEFEFRHLSFRLPKPPLYATLLNVLDQGTTSSVQELEYCADCSLPWQGAPTPGGKLGSVHDMQFCAQGDGRLILYTPALPYHDWPRGRGRGTAYQPPGAMQLVSLGDQRPFPRSHGSSQSLEGFLESKHILYPLQQEDMCRAAAGNRAYAPQIPDWSLSAWLLYHSCSGACRCRVGTWV